MTELANEGTPAEVRSGRRFRSSYLLVPIVLIALVALILYLIPVNEYVFLPGDALPVGPMISIPGHPPKHTRGTLYLTDVSLYKADHLLEDLILRLNGDADFQPATTVSGNLNAGQFNQLNLSLMTDSIHQAEAAALSTIPGYHPHLARTGPKIVFLVPGTPASHRLKIGDVVLAVNGHRTRTAVSVGPLVRRVRPGDFVSLRILRHGRRLTIRLRTVPSTNLQPAPKGKTALIGIEAIDQIVLPLKITINPGSIGGPSAGLMFTLGVIQRLSPTDITHGCRIGGTGTIDAGGNIGPIGGAKQKIIAARNADVRYFFVPDVKDNVDPARAHRGDIAVIPVKTLSQVLHYLKGIKPCR
jgi:PDZ domain-containing protein